MSRRHFPYQHPTFGTKNNPKSPAYWERSIYFWWYEYLKRHEGYKVTCANNGKGEFGDLFDDFGDIHAVDFKSWWTTGTRSIYLFSEPVVEHKMEVIKEMPEAEEGQFFVIKVPLELPKRYLTKEFHALLKKHHTRKRGQRTARESKARYPVTGQPSISGLRLTLQVYDYHIKHPDLALWEVARDLKVFRKEHLPQAGEYKKEVLDKKNRLTAAMCRYIKKANILIENASKGRFPDYKPYQAKK